jgi:hypothetical protein
MGYGLLRFGVVTMCFAASSITWASVVTYVEEPTVATGCVTPFQGTCAATNTNPESGSNAEVVYGSVAGFTTTGGNMNGMVVTVVFSDNVTESGIWVGNTVSSSNTTGTGGANGTANTKVAGNTTGKDSFTISQTGTTYTGQGNDPTGGFNLTNTSTANVTITGIILNGGNGTNGNCLSLAGTAGKSCSTIFDRTGTPNTQGNEQTPGSNIGLDFQIDNGTGGASTTGNYTLSATYSNEVGVYPAATACNNPGGAGEKAATPCLDEWATLTIVFNTTSGVGVAKGASFVFDQDTDTAIGPEPSTFALLGIGLLVGMVCVIRRKKVRMAVAGRP